MKLEKADIKMMKYVKKTVTQEKFFKKFGMTDEAVNRQSRLFGMSSESKVRLIDSAYRANERKGVENVFILTGEGARLLRDYKDEKMTVSRRYWITTSIAITAIIIAIFTLLIQAGFIPIFK